MNTELSCLHCSQPFQWNGQGQQPKFCKPAHRVAHNRKIAKESGLPIPSSPPQEPPQPSPNQPLIAPDGIDYSDPWKVLPPEIAAYMPVQAHQSKADLLHFEKVIHGHTPLSDRTKCPW